MVQGYCLKEKKKVDIKNPEYMLNKKGRAVVRGACPSCGGSVYKILKTTEVPAELKAQMSKLSKKGGASRKSRGSSRKSHKSPKSHKSRKSRRSHRSKK
jgi:hypothetical protein